MRERERVQGTGGQLTKQCTGQLTWHYCGLWMCAWYRARSWKKGKGKGVAEWMRKERAREKERIDLCVTKRERANDVAEPRWREREGESRESHEAEREEDTRGQLEQALFQTSPFLFSSASYRRCALFSTLSFRPSRRARAYTVSEKVNATLST